MPTVATSATSACTIGSCSFYSFTHSILRAFLIEEQKIVKKVAQQKAQQKKEEKSTKKASKKSTKKSQKK